MPEIITEPTRVPVPGGKSIEEFFGRVNSAEDGVSIAYMVAPPGWDEPAQAPEFDEYTVVLDGCLEVECGDDRWSVPAGQAIKAVAGERVRYLTTEGARYISVCLPAFSPDLVRRDPDPSLG